MLIFFTNKLWSVPSEDASAPADSNFVSGDSNSVSGDGHNADQNHLSAVVPTSLPLASSPSTVSTPATPLDGEQKGNFDIYIYIGDRFMHSEQVCFLYPLQDVIHYPVFR